MKRTNSAWANTLLAMTLAAIASPSIAAESVNIKLIKGPRYQADGYTFGPKQLEGYLGAIKEDDGVVEVVLIGADVGGDEGEELFAVAAKRSGLRAMRKEKGSTREL